MIRRHVRKGLHLGAAVFLLAGCSTYIPLEVEEVPIGRPIRVQLSRQAFADLPQISDRTGARFEGTLVTRTPDNIRIHVPLSIGSPYGQDLDIPTSGIIACEVRETSRIKTALAIGGGFAVLISAVVAGSSNKPIQPGNEPEPGQGEEGFRSGARRSFGISIPLF